MVRSHRSSSVVASAALVLVAACASSRVPAGSLEPRFVALHNAFAAMGLAEVGPIHQGTLAEGRESRIRLDLAAGCTAVVAVGSDGLRDIDTTLLGPQGSPVAHDTTSEPQAVLRVCVDAAEPYVLVVKAVAGSGAWVVATWQGGVGGGGPAGGSASRAALEPAGSCESPIPLTEGTVSGTTAHGESTYAGSCAKTSARELVYEFDVAHRQKVTIDVEAHFDSVLYVRKDDCADENAEVACNDDPPDGDRNQSRIERIFEPGKYFVFVDGYGQEGGAFKLVVSASDVLALAEECRSAAPLAAGTTVTGTTDERADDAQASCGGGAGGPDAAWRFDLPSASRVRIVEHSDALAPVIHVRRSCVDPESEMACAEGAGGADTATLTGLFDAGAYTAFADTRETDSVGTYSLALEVASAAGEGGAGDACGDAIPLPTFAPAVGVSVAGDTFAARDDVAGSCGGAGAPDVLYRLDVARVSRFVALLRGEEAPHLLAIWHRCGDRSSEVACGRALDEVLSPGTYFIGVDGTAPTAFGRFALVWTLQDLAAQSGACQNAAVLVEGRTTKGTTVAAGDHFATSCAGGDSGATGPDRVYRFSLAARTSIRLALTAPFSASLALRKACADAPGATDVVELGCQADSDPRRPTTIERSLEAGTYWVVVEGQSPSEQGPFTLDYRVTHPSP